MIAHRFDGVIDVAGDSVAIAALAARPAEPDRGANRGRAAETHVPGDVETARAAAAADRLDDHAIGLVAVGEDGAVRGSNDHAAIARAATGAAETDRDPASDSGRCLEGSADIETAAAAAAADRLDEDAGRPVAPGFDIAADFAGDAAALGAEAAVAGEPNRAAHAGAAGQADASGNVEFRRCRRRRRPTGR